MDITNQFNNALNSLLNSLDPEEIDENRVEIKRILYVLSPNSQQKKIDKWNKYVDIHITNRNHQISDPSIMVRLQSITDVFETLLKESENR